jgi:(S)-sulfolactate dehydrogenase
MKILVPESILPESLERLSRVHEVQFDPALHGDRKALVAAARDADAIIVRRLTQVRGELLGRVFPRRGEGAGSPRRSPAA